MQTSKETNHSSKAISSFPQLTIKTQAANVKPSPYRQISSIHNTMLYSRFVGILVTV
jgi:hypothetical protein